MFCKIDGMDDTLRRALHTRLGRALHYRSFGPMCWERVYMGSDLWLPFPIARWTTAWSTERMLGSTLPDEWHWAEDCPHGQ